MSVWDPRQGYNKGLMDFGPSDEGLIYPQGIRDPRLEKCLEPEEDTYDVLERMAKEKKK